MLSKKQWIIGKIVLAPTKQDMSKSRMKLTFLKNKVRLPEKNIMKNRLTSKVKDYLFSNSKRQKHKSILVHSKKARMNGGRLQINSMILRAKLMMLRHLSKTFLTQWPKLTGKFLMKLVNVSVNFTTNLRLLENLLRQTEKKTGLTMRVCGLIRVEHIHKLRAYLCCKTYTLPLATRQRCRSTV